MLYLMGITNEHNYTPPFVYFLCILTKMYIHTCKNTESIPKIQGLKKYIKQTEVIERSIATGRGRVPLLNHLEKWTPFIENEKDTSV